MILLNIFLQKMELISIKVNNNLLLYYWLFFSYTVTIEISVKYSPIYLTFVIYALCLSKKQILDTYINFNSVFIFKSISFSVELFVVKGTYKIKSLQK